MIHIFKIKNVNFAIDVYSGSIHKIDDIIFLILNYINKNKEENFLTYNEKNINIILKKFDNLYSHEEIIKAYNEIIKLYNDGLIFSKENIYINNIKNIFDYSITKALCLNVVDFCNMKCDYCFVNMNIPSQKFNIMNETVAFKSIDFLVKKSKNIKNLEVDFFGGEPLLAFELIKKIIFYSKKFTNKNFRFTITTNGILLNKKIIKYLNENIDNIIISLDGRKNVNDVIRKHKNENIKSTYDIIVPKFQELIYLRKKLKKDYFIRGTFTVKNLDFSNDFKHLIDLGFHNISLEPILSKNTKLSIKNENIDKILSEYEKICDLIIDNNDKKINFYHYIFDIYNSPCILKRIKGCGAGFEYLCIETNGDIYPCHQLTNNKVFKLGNIKNKFDKKIKYIDKFHQSNVLNNSVCKLCWAKYYCGGGCISSNYNINNNFDIPYKLNCILLKKRIEYSIYINYILINH